ncbi:DNA-directed RNA polymerase subunit beta' [candidate division WS5 bacterium]|uniref:DNA-directed RNA polymerase subunit beta' n=1 Tax=candidate division WS5 bacterium TaxID=2093353 RepID=A0A419DAF2_9BACT|nr:MAG: DNA-directed RNA polymerase subunit beta' [candidate division WS5 bacterium]
MAKIEDKNQSFNAVKISVASPEQILKWSHGEVTKPETINYRTQKPEKDGLFCEKIFGPMKDWECYCGKYKKIRYKGIICDKCGVEVTRSLVRRERMGHMKLAVPVTHIWFLRGIPSSIGLLLEIGVKDLERVVYFANYVVTEVNEQAKKDMIASLGDEFKAKKKEILSKEKDAQAAQKEIEDLENSRNSAKKEIEELKERSILPEIKYREYNVKYGHLFKAGIGAEAIYELLKKVDIGKLVKELKAEVDSSHGQKRKKALKRLKWAEGFKNANIKPEWMIITNLPVIPPDLRPMVQLDGGRFAASDLNDLYRRVINRNNRLKKLIAMDAPGVICRNEKRMLQEAVDALIDSSSKREKVAQGAGQKKKLRSLADMLKGKHGRFRQNLLGKRVDYSGRSVIVVGPELKLHQCGIPKMMALELFKPFVISKLIIGGFAHNIKNASKMIEMGTSEVWDALDEIIKNKYVLLNRAPTLHRLGIQAFQPVLIEGKAIQIHPLVCVPFNADFDGDQMAVHVPLSEKAQAEAREIMLSTKNILKPAAGEPVMDPSQDIVLGCYYMSVIKEGAKGEGKYFADNDEAIFASQMGEVGLLAKIKVKIGDEVVETTIGRLKFNSLMPKGTPYVNEILTKKKLSEIIKFVFDNYGPEETARFVNDIKDLGFHHATLSGISFSMDDLDVPQNKEDIIKEAEERVDRLNVMAAQGLITEEEKYSKNLDLWEKTKTKVQEEMMNIIDPQSPLYIMMDSGARGNVGQLTQLAGMKGNVVNATGRTIELPIKSNYKEGFSSLEYFISTHGARKGLSDTAIKTADAGYLTRRLVDVSQDVIITEKDCKDTEGMVISKEESQQIGEDFSQRVIGRVLAENAVSKKTGEIVVKKGVLVTEDDYRKIEEAEIDEVKIRSVLTCKVHWGVCQKCYGADLARGGIINLGEAIGIIAAQSIGEPGTQLTMRTFRAGGVAGADITQGLPRVEEIFEARPPKGQAILAEIAGKAAVEKHADHKILRIASLVVEKDEYEAKGGEILVKNNQAVEAKDVILKDAKGKAVKAKNSGIVKISKDKDIVSVVKEADIKEYTVPKNVGVLVSDGDEVSLGQQLTEGSWNLQDALSLLGENAVQRYITTEVQQIYASQGQTINDKHIEVIIRQMFSRLKIDDPGDTSFVSGNIVSRTSFLEENAKVKKKGGKTATATNLLLSITKVSLSTDSFLSAASFMETNRILIDAATKGKVDNLRGLKENVIIGKLVPVGTGFHKND